jgi:hypothetical protein
VEFFVASLAYADMASEQGDRKVEHESLLSTLEVVPPALMMRGGAMDGGRVIA